MAHVFVTRRLPGPALDRLGAQHDVDLWPGEQPPSTEQLLAHTAEAEGLLSLLTDRVDAALLDASPRLRVVSNYAVGVDNIDLEATAARGIPVGHTPDVLTDATADLAFALLLAAARGLPQAIAAARAGSGDWAPGEHLGHSVHGRTLGIIGFGRIGRAVAARAAGFEMPVLAHSSSSGVPVDELLERSDFVSLHCPLTEETRHLIDGRALALMKPTAVLVNTARGPIIDQLALAAALRDGTIAAAALDVTDPEPLPADDPLWDAPNLIVLPHIGSATHSAREQMAEMAVDNLLAGLAGDPLPHEVGAS